MARCGRITGSVVTATRAGARGRVPPGWGSAVVGAGAIASGARFLMWFRGRHHMAGIEVEGTEMVHMAVDDLVSAAQGSAWRTLAVLVLLGILSFTAVSDQSNAR